MDGAARHGPGIHQLVRRHDVTCVYMLDCVCQHSTTYRTEGLFPPFFSDMGWADVLCIRVTEVHIHVYSGKDETPCTHSSGAVHHTLACRLYGDVLHYSLHLVLQGNAHVISLCLFRLLCC